MRTQTILVVEDEALIRMSLSEYLQEEGFHTHEAANSEAARAILRVSAVDLIITDVRTDGHRDGIELAQWVRANKPDVPVIVMSGAGEADVRRDLGLQQYFLRKPVDYVEMMALIKLLLAKSVPR